MISTLANPDSANSGSWMGWYSIYETDQKGTLSYNSFLSHTILSRGKLGKMQDLTS